MITFISVFVTSLTYQTCKDSVFNKSSAEGVCHFFEIKRHCSDWKLSSEQIKLLPSRMSLHACSNYFSLRCTPFSGSQTLQSVLQLLSYKKYWVWLCELIKNASLIFNVHQISIFAFLMRVILVLGVYWNLFDICNRYFGSRNKLITVFALAF